LNLLESKLDAFQDEDNPENWFLHCAKDGQLKPRSTKGGYGICNGSTIAQDIIASTKNDPKKSIKALIANEIEEDGMTLYPLLIKKGSESTFTNKL
jgi:hypothetical protein